ncbi:MAG: hypothetical protein OHM77_07350 [Candidatus Nitricoxidivorans perseverans]|uniref:PilZ domain-containing protein n=1 Tax=Candidatus Nitricoxidivorans perseverans TaxID=2975601 RepID=A0AA49IRB6_9PROT|nr:MAG: hypothetical protein OHM77_07350 [Candidatus Nitricoxidivorans perseverans]
MLGMFSSRPDHPLADSREVRRILAELPAQEPAAAIDSATAWLESLVASEEFRPDRRLELVLQLDEAALPQSRRLGREYLTAPRPGRAQEFKLWQLNRNYWGELVTAYETVLAQACAGDKGIESIKDHLPLLYARLLHANGGRLKWDQFRYGPIDGLLWMAAGRAYLAAVQGNVARRGVMLYPGAETMPEAEYLKMLVFHASSMDSLLPIEIEIAERLIAHFLPRFAFTDQVRPENVYWVDAAKPLPPTRLAKLPEIAPTLRFFSTGQAIESVVELRSRIEQTGELPASINFGGQYSPRVVLPVLDHLAICWAPKPPVRSHTRHRVKSRLTVVSGLAAIHRRLAGQAGPNGAEAWIAEDVSMGGMGAEVPLAGNDWVRIGALLGMQPDGGDNWLIGVIRRFSRETESAAAVGIKTISKTPRAIVADCGGLQTEGVLLDPPVAGDDVRVLVPAADWEEKIPLLFTLDGMRVRLFPQAMVDSGPDYSLGRYRVETI